MLDAAVINIYRKLTAVNLDVIYQLNGNLSFFKKVREQEDTGTETKKI